MFRKYLTSYYRIFHANNKLCIRTFSSWQNSPIQFGSKFTQIQQNGNAHCNNILFQTQQRYQFSSRNDGNNNHLPNLAIRLLWLDPYKKKNLKLELQKGKSDQKYFRITLNNFGELHNFSNILVPQDAYPFVYALDQLIWELTTKNFEQKLQIPVSNHGYKTDRRIKLQTIELDGLFQKFKLELLFYVNTENGVLVKEICFLIHSENKTNMKKRSRTFPLLVLPWLRNQMAEMLALHDGTEQIALKAPAQIPQQFFHKVESTNGRTTRTWN